MIGVDRHTVLQVLGGLMNRPHYLSDIDKYRLEISDFSTTLDRYIFSAINNLYNSGDGAINIKATDIIHYLNDNAAAAALLKKENGELYLQDCEMNGDPENFKYYYDKLKKINFLRDIQSTGRNIDKFYCEDILNPKYSQINDRFESLTIKDILNELKTEVDSYEKKFVLKGQFEESYAVDGVRDLIKELKEKPEIGCKLQGDIFNTVCRGGRKGKLYLRSAGTSVGKTRSMVGDACYIAYPIRFDREKGEWVSTGSAEKVLYVMTEQDTSEIQTMILAYLTGYNEEIFLYGTYGEEEMPRIEQAIDIMEKYKDNMLFAHMPDPCASAVKNLFRRYNIQNSVENFFFDYIFSSPAMLNEYRDLKLPEYVCLRLFTTALKNLAVELNSFILTSTQISNDDDEKGGFRDVNYIQGAKQIGNLVDFGCIMSRPTKYELNQLSGVQEVTQIPNLVIDIFKNRRGKWTMMRIWCLNDLGCCRRKDLFATTADMKPIKDFNIVDFTNYQADEFEELCQLYNDGIVSDKVYEEFYQPSDIKPEELILNAAAAFNDEAKKETVKNKKFNDFLNF